MSTNIKVIKRNNEVVDFDKRKIEKAILRAMKYGSGIVDEKIAKEIATQSDYDFINAGLSTITIKDIEDVVYISLIEHDQIETAKSYEGYRAVQEFKRSHNTTDETILNLIGGKNSEVANENSNKNAVLISTQRDLIAGEVSKDIARRKILPAHIVQAHDTGSIHYHDMDYSIQPMFNCCLINLEDMFKYGTVINEKLVETPTCFSTAATITTQIIAQIASNQYGGNSITLSHLAPYLRLAKAKHRSMFNDILSGELLDITVDRLTKKELKDGIQTIRYQLSTLQTTNGQSPFVTTYLEIIEGYEYESEQADICEEMIKQRLEGMKNEKGQIIGETFPKLVYVLEEHNSLQGGKYDYITELCIDCNIKRLVPDYQSGPIMRRNYEGNNFPPMGCRSHLSPWKDADGNYKFYGRFNQGVVSLNLPQIALIAEGNMNVAMPLLDERLELCFEALMFRHNSLLGTKSDVSPIHWQHGALARLKPGEVIDPLLKNGYSTISLGYVGIHEFVQRMIGESHTTKKGQELALMILDYLKAACDKWKKETGLGFGLYGTPGESLTSRFCSIDTKRFGVIKNVTDRKFYTNSYHVHVEQEIDAFEKLEFEAQFHKISSGGCISYIESPDLSKNKEPLRQIVRHIFKHVQYGEINTRPDVCYCCGFEGEIKLNENMKWQCPECENNDHGQMQVMRRTCGYIGATEWSEGRTAEIGARVTHL